MHCRALPCAANCLPNKCTMRSCSDSDSDGDCSMTIGVPSAPSAAMADATCTDDGSEASSAKSGTTGTTGTNDTACAADNGATIFMDDKDNKDNRGQTQSKNKSERARQRWAILRAALLGNSNDDANSDANGTRANNANNASNDASTSTQVNRASIHRFEGFQLLHRKLLSTKDAEKCKHLVNDLSNGGKIEDKVQDKDEQEQAQEDEDDHKYEYAEYAIPVPSNPPIQVWTRERRRRTGTQKGQDAHSNADDSDGKKKRIDQLMRGLLSHRLHGVDNTGQSCIWDSESTLTHCLLAPADSSYLHSRTKGSINEFRTAPFPLGIDNILSLAVSAPSENAVANEQNPQKKLRVIELGAGMAGLCGLSLAAFGMMSDQSNTCASSSSSGVDVDIQLTLTDGHPDAVRSNRICAALTSQLYTNASSSNNVTPNRRHIACQRLLWNDGDDGVEDCRALTNNGQDRYQMCLASDCVHFQEFHAALLATIGRLLDVGGICLLCQPRRADSLKNFMKVVDAVNTCGAADVSAVFEMKLFDRYNQRLWDLHQKELAKGDDGIYDPDIHYPLLLVLKKVGEYKEDAHTAAAIGHVEERQRTTRNRRQ